MGINLGAIAGGVNQGLDWAQRDQQIADNRAYQQEQMSQWRKDNEWRGGLQRRQQDAFEREDQLATRQAALPKVGEEYGDAIPGTDVGPTPGGEAVGGIRRKQTAASLARQQGDMLKEARQYEAADKKYAWADELGMKAAADSFHAFNSGYKGNDAQEYAKGLARVVTDDQSPVTVTDVQPLDGGRVRAKFQNRHNGTSVDADFGSIDEMRQAALRHYDPATYKANIDAARKTQERISEIRAKPLELQPGSQAFDHMGNVIASNTNESSAEKAARIKVGAGGATGSGTGKAVDPNKVLNDTLEFIGKNSNMKDWTPDVTARVQQYAYQVVQNSGGKLPPQMAGSIAIDAATNPNKLQPRLDPVTGLINLVYESPDAGQIKFTSGYASARQPANVAPEQFKGFAKQIVQSQPPELRDKFVAAAFDSGARGALEQGVRDEISAMYLKQIQASPEARDQLVAQRDATISSTMESIGRKLDIVSGHYPKPSAQQQPVSDRLGIGSASPSAASKYTGMTPKQIDEEVASGARAFRAEQAAKKPVVSSDAQARARQDIARLDAEKSSLLKAGKAVEANARIEQIKQIRAASGI